MTERWVLESRGVKQNALPNRHSQAQDALYEGWMRHDCSVRLSCVDGRIVEGRLVNYDTYALHLVDQNGQDQLVFKHGVVMIEAVVDPDSP